MPQPRKQKPRRKPFVVTVAQVAAVAALLPGCMERVTTNPPYVGLDDCPTLAPTAGAACSDVTQCSYDSAGCTEVYSCNGVQWEVTTGCNPPGPCPAAEPAQASPCSEPATCTYTVDYGCGPETNTATCDGATWSVQWGGASCNPPPPDYCSTIAAEMDCMADPACRWLTPGCGTPPLPQAGCFAATDCTGDFDCVISGGTCQQAAINPCYNLACDACSMTVSVCLPPP
jgi:hypothetical protein